jgi:hypothetical protein
LLSNICTGDAEACRLRSAQEKVRISLDELQSKVYAEAFDDVSWCAASLREIFDVHAVAVSKIHAVIDDIKQRALASLSAEQVPQLALFQEGTARLAMAIWDMIET